MNWEPYGITSQRGTKFVAIREQISGGIIWQNDLAEAVMEDLSTPK